MSDQKRLFPGLPFSSLPPVEASCSPSRPTGPRRLLSLSNGNFPYGRTDRKAPFSVAKNRGPTFAHRRNRQPGRRRLAHRHSGCPWISRRRFCSPSRHCDSRALHARQSRRFLESPSLPPPPAALRAIPRNPLASSASGSASPQKHRPASRFPSPKGAGNRGRSSKQACFFRHWRRFACFHITRWKTLCIMWKTSRYVILWKSCENFAHPLCTAKVL